MNKKMIMLMSVLMVCAMSVSCGVLPPASAESSSTTSSSVDTMDSSSNSIEESLDNSSSDSIVESSSDSSEEDSVTSSSEENSSESSSLDSSEESSDSESSSEIEKKEVTVTFQQNGAEDIIVTIIEGESLTDIPTPIEKTGYIITWDRTDFSNITEDMTVTAIETAKTYTVTLQTNGGSVAQETITVTYGQAYELPTPTHSEHVFSYWTYADVEIATQGVWTIDAEEIVLTVKWSEGCWSGNY